MCRRGETSDPRRLDLSSVKDPLYKNDGHAADIQVLLEGEIAGQAPEAIAWTREVNGGRIFYTSLAEATFQNTSFRRMLANALFWTVRRSPEKKGS